MSQVDFFLTCHALSILYRSLERQPGSDLPESADLLSEVLPSPRDVEFLIRQGDLVEPFSGE